MNIAYIRVSSADQNPGRQVEALKLYHIEKTFSERITGKNMSRPELKAMLDFAREGDTIYIESISRLARNTLDFLKLVEQFKEKKVNLVSLKESIDTATPQGQFVLSIFAALSQLERDTIRQRQREGIDLALQEGRAYGRPKRKITDDFKRVYRRWKDGAISAVEAMRLTSYSKTSFYRAVKELERE